MLALRFRKGAETGSWAKVSEVALVGVRVAGVAVALSFAECCQHGPVSAGNGPWARFSGLEVYFSALLLFRACQGHLNAVSCGCTTEPAAPLVGVVRRGLRWSFRVPCLLTGRFANSYNFC